MESPKTLLFFQALIFCYNVSFTQAPVKKDYTLPIYKATSPIHLDGILDEAAWQVNDSAGDFYMNYPIDTAYAELVSEVKVTFDDVFLYVGATLYQPQSSYITTSMKRDYSIGDNDEFEVNIDPFKDKINGFHFAVTPLNIQREGQIDNGGNLTMDWDNKWYSKVTNYDDRWVVEMAIPFKTLRYKMAANGQNTWRINFVRYAAEKYEWATWVPIPWQFAVYNLAFSGILEWKDPPPKPGVNISLIPYVTARYERDYELKLPTEYSWNAGFDAKVAVTPSLNLDITVNPDFSQVEVDEQITDLSRFELFYPEKRQFFLENEDLFSKFGFPTSRPFFSRRIGLAFGTIRKTTTEGQIIEVARNVEVPIIAGARLSGKLDDNWRIGLLNMQTAAVKDIGLNPANYSVGVLQRKVFDRSYAGIVFANKENFEPRPEGGYKLDPDGYNRVAGIEYNLFSKDNSWEAELFYHRSFTEGNNKDAQAAAIFVGKYTRLWKFFLPAHYVGSNHRADIGFVPRTGFLAASPGVTRFFFPKKPFIRNLIYYGIDFSNDFIFNNPDQLLVDRAHWLKLFVGLQGNSEISLSAGSDYTYLFFPFDPTNSGGLPLPEGTDYTYNTLVFSYSSDTRKKLYGNLNVATGQYFNGQKFSVDGSLAFRVQPYGILAASWAYNDIELPEPFSKAAYWLVGPKAELSFTRSLFFSAFLQYNTQLNNVNINARLQWRFQPVSDVFLVYTDNYYSETFFTEPATRNRALVLKVTYWLNL